ncbi:hypothetical protein RHMOL_Rhmol03G0202900 [Rhododendron molle]|uniref:Uncharacterized protein n=1 Tax=Rhododendron molle TaxID=49168 RepID=A0ACC0PHZ5_RHOML|nr:hypothetical protein RHMOL_Rhmol03G0202900 [Rhododendron molle]
MLQESTLQNRRRLERVEEDRGLGFAHRQPLDQNRNRVERFTRNQLIHQNVSRGYSYHKSGKEDDYEGVIGYNEYGSMR